MAEEGPAAVDVDELAVDEDVAPLEIEAVDGEAEDLALLKSGASGEDHERLMPPGRVRNDRGELVLGDRQHRNYQV